MRRPTHYRLPDPPSAVNTATLSPEIAELQAWARRMADYTASELRKRVPSGVALGHLYLTSPNGSVYSVGVEDDGTLTTTLVQGPGDES